MVQLILIGIGAGAATALLFASVASGALISVVLFYLAPLPILIAALGWSHWAALIAAVTASVGLAVVFGGYFFIAFLVGIGLPAWWIGYLALLARPGAGPTPDAIEWYPIGNLVVWAALIGALIVIAAMLNVGADEETFRANMRRGLERMLRLGETAPGGPLPRVREPNRLVEFLIVALPAAAAILTTITNILNLWLAARVVAVSGRLRRPMPDLSAMRFPVYAPLLLAIALAASFASGLLGIGGGILAASMLIAFAILGFAVLHAITRGINSRLLMLGAIYAAMIVFGWPVLAMSLIGLADTAFDIRGRVARRRGGPPART